VDAEVLRETVARLVRATRELAPDRVHVGIVDALAAFGGSDVVVYLNDFEQRVLVGLASGETVSVDDGSPVGAAFQTCRTQRQDATDGRVRLSLPLLDGTERVGVLELEVDDDEEVVDWCEDVAALVADVILSRGRYTDRQFWRRQRAPMDLAAGMQWSLLPPLNLELPGFAVAGVVEPAYDVGGDCFDFAANDDCLHVCVLDAMGHGVQSALTASLGLGAYKNARRERLSLVDTVASMDREVAEHRAAGFATTVLLELDVTTGELVWIDAGHPPPLLLTGEAVVPLVAETGLPIGFGEHDPGRPPGPSSLRLRPGDAVLVLTDGVTDNAGISAEDVADRFCDHRNADRPLVEALRRTMRDLLGLADECRDDATLVAVELRS
jgi:serine phosphatase RsbU (regulator of sigma subunit)